jgi:hypothetical protein
VADRALVVAIAFGGLAALFPNGQSPIDPGVGDRTSSDCAAEADLLPEEVGFVVSGGPLPP